MIYLDNSATGGKKPDSVLTALSSVVRVCANAGRGGHKLALASAKIVQDCRKALNDFFDGYGYERVVFTKNCTEALNVALFGILEQGDHQALLQQRGRYYQLYTLQFQKNQLQNS